MTQNTNLFPLLTNIRLFMQSQAGFAFFNENGRGWNLLPFFSPYLSLWRWRKVVRDDLCSEVKSSR